MVLFATRLTILAAVALVAFAQVVVSPASCCLLRSALLEQGSCCLTRAEPAQKSCCHGRLKDGDAPLGPSLVDRSDAPSSQEDCLWCSAGPKTLASERAGLPAPDLFALPVTVVGPSVTAPAFFDRLLDEPFHRTALASCAWLCVWRK